ncbi:MAG: ComEC/Rec2 family competence protein, partial [Clostridia bacterium]|nr:ComEC/Rec2 family competence protein [Clostridia bacterium]
VNATLKLSIVEEYDEYFISDYSSGVYTTANMIKLKKSGDYNLFYKTAGNIRSYVKNTISSRFNGDTSGLLVALTTGDKTLISDKFLANIKTTGISHVVVVSGMHLAIIMMAVFWCLDRMFYNKYIRCLVSLISVILISAVCGFTMSISRAGVMFVIASLAPAFSRENDSLSSLLTAVTAVLISAPFAIFNISFQLSVLSTLAIVWVVPYYSKLIQKKFNIKSKILKFLIDTFLCSIFAIIFTLPVIIKTFGFVSIVSPITNFIISYPVMIALIFNIASLVLSTIPLIRVVSTVLFFVAGVCSRFIVFIVNLIAKLPITVAVLPQSAFWWAILLIAMVIGFMYIYEFKKKRSDLNANSV